MRYFNLIDRVLLETDLIIRTIFPPLKRHSNRPVPGEHINETFLDSADKKHIAGLMRVNHAGEVCAQALYQGQALTARLTAIKDQMTQSAVEEVDHLSWCEQRLRDLNSKPSLLNPLWYLGSFTIGALAGLAGDRFSLGFVAETEQQVSAHLQKHLSSLPVDDEKTKAILKQMYEDEAHHADIAKQAGAAELPDLIKQLMSITAKIMTKSSYYI